MALATFRVPSVKKLSLPVNGKKFGELGQKGRKMAVRVKNRLVRISFVMAAQAF